YVFLGILHPFEGKRRRPVIEVGQTIHPADLASARQLAQTDERHPVCPAQQTADQFACVGPDPADRVGGHQNVHSKSSIVAGTGAWISLYPLSLNVAV